MTWCDMFDDLDALGTTSSLSDVEVVKVTYLGLVKDSFDQLDQLEKIPDVLTTVSECLRRVWQVPTYGHEIGTTICNFVRDFGGLEILIRRLMSHKRQDVKLASAMVLEQCLTADNCKYISEKYLLDQVLGEVSMAKEDDSAFLVPATAIISHLTKHSEEMCGQVVQFGTTDAILRAFQSTDVQTLRNCASVAANLSMYGTVEHLERLYSGNVPRLLFELIWSTDDRVVKYYAFLATVFLAVKNGKAKSEIVELGTLGLVESFLKSSLHSDIRNGRVESKNWLKNLVELLRSAMEEAQNMAAFYFVLEAQVQRNRLNTEIFWEIGAIEPLRTLKSSSSYAREALQLISENVRAWEIKHVIAWLEHIGFAQFVGEFKKNLVTGETLLDLTEEGLIKDIGMNTIRSKSFMSKLKKLKMKDDLYTTNNTSCPSKPEKSSGFDVFISYRRSTGKDLASLIKKYLEERNYSVFIDVEHLQSGLFDEQLLRVIENAAIFILLLTSSSLDRCFNDLECKDWIHQEIVAGLKNGCTFIPVMADFTWPIGSDYDALPEKIKEVGRYQGMTWDHTNQKGSVNKLAKYIRDALLKHHKQ